MEHTKGPWRIERTVDRLYIHGTDNLGGPIDESTLVAQVGFFKTEANARLIAAAPELLTQLKILNNLLAQAGFGRGGTDLDDEAVNTALLIKKAEGEEK